jgi:hypothetical protein
MKVTSESRLEFRFQDFLGIGEEGEYERLEISE